MNIKRFIAILSAITLMVSTTGNVFTEFPVKTNSIKAYAEEM